MYTRISSPLTYVETKAERVRNHISTEHPFAIHIKGPLPRMPTISVLRSFVDIQITDRRKVDIKIADTQISTSIINLPHLDLMDAS
jgi:hypothetical protein